MPITSRIVLSVVFLFEEKDHGEILKLIQIDHDLNLKLRIANQNINFNFCKATY